jgi:hypothetical protein
MKKFFLTSFFLGLAFLILGVSLFQASASNLYSTSSAELQPIGAEEATGEAVAELFKKEKVNYYLPYPGILPDHPLYFLKMARDRVELFLTSNALKKAEKFLHFADKRIGAAQALVSGNQTKLGVTTASKAEKYLERAIDQEKTADDKDLKTKSFLARLVKACQKHEEILLEIKEKVESEEETIEQLLSYPRDGLERVRERLEE